jgi:DNA-directed RNA polymerase specialized sigma subunit
VQDYQSRVPWSRELSLKEKAAEVGVDFDRLMRLMAQNRNDTEMAEELGVPEALVRHLRRHFETYGVHSVMGQD